MKRTMITLFCVSLCIASFSQNTSPFPASGNVGIGTTAPTNLLEVYNANAPANTIGSTSEIAKFSGNTPNPSSFKFLLRRHILNGAWESVGARLQFTTDVYPQGYLEFNPINALHGVAIGSGTSEIIRFMNNGNVSIGTSQQTTFKLTVEGKIGAREIQVTAANPWPDYVFKKEYKLMSMDSLNNYLKFFGHLPNIPSAQEVHTKGGIELGDMTTKLLEKIEELTLYMIELNKKLTTQSKTIEELKLQVAAK